MDQHLNGFEILDMYYADCIQTAGIIPQWSTVRTRSELTDEESLNKLRQQVEILRRKRKLAHTFRDVPIPVDHPRNNSVRVILEQVLGLPLGREVQNELLQYGDVLARKYLQTRYSRTRLFILVRVLSNGEIFLFTILADLKDNSFQQIHRESHDFTTQAIRNIYGDLKKGSMYPAIVNGQRNLSEILIYDEGNTIHYPESLECIRKLAPENEARAILNVLSETCRLRSNQVERVFNEIRALEIPRFGRNDLGQILGRTGIQVNQQEIDIAWRKQFNTDRYEVSPDVMSLDTVQITIHLDEFKINCPLHYYPDRIEHREEGGYQFLTLRGQDYRQVKIGSSAIVFPD